MRIKLGKAAIKKVCNNCEFSYLKMNKEPCSSCIFISDKEIHYKNFKRKENGR